MGILGKKEEINPLETKTAEDIYGSKTIDSTDNYITHEIDKENEDETSFQKRKKEILAREINIKAYKDPEGLTLQKMSIGLWLVEHRKIMWGIVYAFLIIVSGVTWFNFFFTFGNYLLFGIREDQLLLRGMIETEIISHRELEERGARDIKVSRVQVFKNDGKYDFLVQLDNVNPDFWGNFDYFFKDNDAEFGHAQGFVLPGEEKFIVSLGHEFDFFPADARLVIQNLSWKRVNKHKYPNWKEFRDVHLNLKISDVVFTPAPESQLSEKINLSDLKFTVHNDTPYNYWDVGFIILLKAQGGKVMGINKYILENVMSEEIYNIAVTWPGMISNVKDVVILPDVNITRDDIYIDF